MGEKEEKDRGVISPTTNAISATIDIIGIVIGLGLIDLYLWLWISALYNGDLVAEDFRAINLWIMIMYFVLGIGFFLISLKYIKKRIDYCIIGILSWGLLFLVYYYLGDYLKALTLPFMIG